MPPRWLPLAFLSALLCAPAAFADTVNVREAASLLDFSVAARRSGAEESGLAALDLDGDGLVSKAEAAGNAEVTLGFDRADRNRDGRISEKEWARYEKWQERRAKARAAREARLAKAREKQSASAGGTREKR